MAENPENMEIQDKVEKPTLIKKMVALNIGNKWRNSSRWTKIIFILLVLLAVGLSTRSILFAVIAWAIIFYFGIRLIEFT